MKVFIEAMMQTRVATFCSALRNEFPEAVNLSESVLETVIEEGIMEAQELGFSTDGDIYGFLQLRFICERLQPTAAQGEAVTAYLQHHHLDPAYRLTFVKGVLGV